MSAAGAEVDERTAEARDRLVVVLNRMVNKMAWRDDLILHCVWNPKPVKGQPDAPAWFVPADLTVTLNGHIALDGAQPWEVNLLTATGRRAHPGFVGLLAHEASHAHSTRWEGGFGSGLPRAVAKAAVLLEEPRIEHRQLTRRPQDQPYLRAQSLMLDLRQFASGRSTAGDRWSAAAAAVMTLARADAGVLTSHDVAPVLPVLRDLLGEDDLTALRDLWHEALDAEDGDTDTLVDIATRWVEVVGTPPEAEMMSLGCLMAVGGSAGEQPPTEDDGWDDPDDSGAGAGDSGDEADRSAAGGSLAAVLQAVAESASTGAESDLDAEESARPDPGILEAKKQAEADDAKQQKDRRAADRIMHGNGGGRGDITLGTPRLPTTAERVAARRMGEALRRAQFRDRTVTHLASAAPPGRLSGREAMFGHAQRSMGQMVTAKPFKQTVRRRVPEPPVTLGVMTDGSGSMGWAADIMASLAWTMAHAVTYVHGQAASVVFGGQATVLAKPGQPPTHVTPFSTDAGWENFSAGFSLLDGALNLTRGSGVRLLVVVSDGHFVQPGQPEAAREAVARLRRNGAYVLWIPGNGIVPDGAVGVDIDFSRRGSGTAWLDQVPQAVLTALVTMLRG